jgi:hypothetical protein
MFESPGYLQFCEEVVLSIHGAEEKRKTENP